VGKSSVASISFNYVSEEKPTREKEPLVTETASEKPSTVDGKSHARWLRKRGFGFGWNKELITFSFKRKF
jgi:hypothetical protein